MGWTEFILAMAVFFALHAIPVQPPIKARIVALTGVRGFTILYSLVSLGVLTWLIIAAGRAPVVALWDQAVWHKHLVLPIMALASLIFALGVARPNPLSFGGARNDSFDPSAPGIVGWTRHPLLATLALWSFAHLLANGVLSHVILFGLLGGFSLLGMKMIDRRKKRQMGADWARLSDLKRETRITRAGAIRVLVGLAAYIILLAAHPFVIGVNPLP